MNMQKMAYFGLGLSLLLFAGCEKDASDSLAGRANIQNVYYQWNDPDGIHIEHRCTVMGGAIRCRTGNIPNY